MGRKGNISREDRGSAKKVMAERYERFRAKVEELRMKLKSLWPEGEYRNDVVVHPLLVQIVCNCYGFKYEQGLFWEKSITGKKMRTHIYAGEHIDHFINYYMLDDGEIRKFNGEWIFCGDVDGMRKEEAVDMMLKELE